ncbi:hypothetical protein [Streptomyces sp. YIM 98790]|uniref:hypothetical protein n=1 Tax=Streptomyces sp. YIM 98790 TaxID=2689077 RepID=UPI0028BE73E0|nr:hypothetical protein [Streptomyces sp. YIM 98790]
MFYVLLGAVALIASVVQCRLALRMWKSAQAALDMAARMFMFGKEVSKGVVRGYVPFTAIGFSMSGALISGGFWQMQVVSGDFLGHVFLVITGFFYLSTAATVSIIAFNRPKFLVLPQCVTEETGTYIGATCRLIDGRRSSLASLCTRAPNWADKKYRWVSARWPGSIVGRTCRTGYTVSGGATGQAYTREITAYDSLALPVGSSHVTTDTHAYMLQDLNYIYDQAGNVTSIADPVTLGGTTTPETQCFTYDGHRRLTDAWTPLARTVPRHRTPTRSAARHRTGPAGPTTPTPAPAPAKPSTPPPVTPPPPTATTMPHTPEP